MTEELRRTFPKKPAPGTPFKSPIPKFKRDQERWSKERKEINKSERKEKYGIQHNTQSNSVGGRYFEAGRNEEEKKQKIEERRANKKVMKEEGRKAKMELKMKKREVNKVKKEDRKRKGDAMEGGKKKKIAVKKRKPSLPAEESDDPESEGEEERKTIKKKIKKETKPLPHLGDSDIDSDDLPGDDMFGNEKEEEVDGDEKEEAEDEEEDEEESEGETVPLASTRVNKYSEKEDEEEEGDGDGEEGDEEDDAEDGEGEEDEEEAEEDNGPALTDLEKFREEMASLPLSKVREVKEKLGIKLFNDAFFGRAEKKEEETVEGNPARKFFKRENSKRPREVSSKKGASRFRPIYNEKKTKNRLDPRFDERCGAFNEVIYDTNYGFLDELRTEEVKKMKKDVQKAKKEGDGEKVAHLREEIIREENRQKAKKEKEMRMNTMKELKKENMERMKKGLQPKFVKRSEVKMKIMEKKFEQLKEDNQLDKYLRRKAKKESRKGSSGKGVGPKLGVGH